jgi:hypothetical protein
MEAESDRASISASRRNSPSTNSRVCRQHLLRSRSSERIIFVVRRPSFSTETNPLLCSSNVTLAEEGGRAGEVDRVKLPQARTSASPAVVDETPCLGKGASPGLN